MVFINFNDNFYFLKILKFMFNRMSISNTITVNNSFFYIFINFSIRYTGCKIIITIIIWFLCCVFVSSGSKNSKTEMKYFKLNSYQNKITLNWFDKLVFFIVAYCLRKLLNNIFVKHPNKSLTFITNYSLKN
jgi:hypothetical protein